MTATYVPGDSPFRLGYQGPAEFLQFQTWYRGVLLSPTHGYISRPGYGDDIAGYSPVNIRFDASCREVRDHIGRAMAEGVPCSGACSRVPTSSRFVGRSPIPGHVYGVSDSGDTISMFGCPDCGGDPSQRGGAGTGYSLRPVKVEHLLDRPGAKLNAVGSAVLIAWSARSWLRGGSVIVDVCGNYTPSQLLIGGRPQSWVRQSILPPAPGMRLSVLVAPDGWSISRNGHHAWDVADYVARGVETGEEGRACANAALLANHIAYCEQGSIVVPDEVNHAL